MFCIMKQVRIYSWTFLKKAEDSGNCPNHALCHLYQWFQLAPSYIDYLMGWVDTLQCCCLQQFQIESIIMINIRIFIFTWGGFFRQHWKCFEEPDIRLSTVLQSEIEEKCKRERRDRKGQMGDRREIQMKHKSRTIPHICYFSPQSQFLVKPLSRQKQVSRKSRQNSQNHFKRRHILK